MLWQKDQNTTLFRVIFSLRRGCCLGRTEDNLMNGFWFLNKTNKKWNKSSRAILMNLSNASMPNTFLLTSTLKFGGNWSQVQMFCLRSLQIWEMIWVQLCWYRSSAIQQDIGFDDKQYSAFVLLIWILQLFQCSKLKQMNDWIVYHWVVSKLKFMIPSSKILTSCSGR